MVARTFGVSMQTRHDTTAGGSNKCSTFVDITGVLGVAPYIPMVPDHAKMCVAIPVSPAHRASERGVTPARYGLSRHIGDGGRGRLTG